MKAILKVLIMIVISGCATFPAKTAQEICLGHGFKPGPELAHCSMQVEEARLNRAEVRRGIVVEAFRGLGNNIKNPYGGAAFQQQYNSVQRDPQNCTTTKNFGIYNTTCY